MAKRRTGRNRRRPSSNGNGTAFYEELSVSAFSRAFHSHIEDLSYEMLKDPEYQAWMRKWLEGFLEIGLRKIRAGR